MLRTIKDLEGYAIGATDGEIGRVTDILFDDLSWTLRYLVVETGSWLASKKVLISPFAVGARDFAARRLEVSITREQVRLCPDVDTEKPVTRQHEVQYLEYYHFPKYWGGADLWGHYCYPGLMLSGIGSGESDAAFREAQAADLRAADYAERSGAYDPHLRSAEALQGYHVLASDGDSGHLRGMLIDEDSWNIRFCVIDTGSWWLGHQVLVAPKWITEVRWAERAIAVDLLKDAIEHSPLFDAAHPLERAEADLLDAYPGHRRGRTGANDRHPPA
jgi:hypothetical protein